MVRDYQIDALRRDITHVDLLRDRPEQGSPRRRCRSSSPASPRASSSAASCTRSSASSPIACKPDNIPVKLEVDVSPLGIGDVIHVCDLKLAAGVRAARRRGPTICAVDRAEGREGSGSEVAAGAAAKARRRLRRRRRGGSGRAARLRRRVLRPGGRREGAATQEGGCARPQAEGRLKLKLTLPEKCVVVDVARRRARQSGREVRAQPAQHRLPGRRRARPVAGRLPGWRRQARRTRSRMHAGRGRAAQAAGVHEPLGAGGAASAGVLQGRAAQIDRRPRRDRSRRSASSGSRSAAATAATTGCDRSSSSSATTPSCACAAESGKPDGSGKERVTGHVLGDFPQGGGSRIAVLDRWSGRRGAR